MTKVYNVGEKVTFDGNYHGVNPRIGTATIIEIKGGLATRGCSRPDKVYKVQGEDGYVFHIDEVQIIE